MVFGKKKSDEDDFTLEEKEKVKKALKTHGWISVPPRDFKNYKE